MMIQPADWSKCPGVSACYRFCCTTG